jgi:5-enolpyruvylshikimate-3-phosphate synthase
MTHHWLKLRWPVTALALGGMALAGLVRLTHHPIQVKLDLSFTLPLQLSGKVKGELNMPRAVQIEPTRSLAVKVVEHAPINLSMTNRTPVEVQVRNAQPIQVQVDESKPIQVDMDPQAPVKVKVGF